jgi:hypothetical protein
VASCLAEAIATNCFSVLSFLAAPRTMVRDLTTCELRDAAAHAAARRTAARARRRLVEHVQASCPVHRTTSTE